MPYLVTSPLVLVRVPDQVGDGYRVDYHYQDSVIPWLSDEQEERFLDEGLVEKVGRKAKDPAPLEVHPDVVASSPVLDVEPPAKVATQKVWAEFAVSKGADPTEAAALSKADLIELYGG